MIRNLLYAICLHLLFFLFIFFAGEINRNIAVEDLGTLEIEDNFLYKNNIVTTKNNIYSKLSLQEKVDLYKLSRKYNDINEKISNPKKDQNVIESTGDILYVGPTDYRKLLNRGIIDEGSITNNKNNTNIKQLKNETVKIRGEINKILENINTVKDDIKIDEIFTKKDIRKIKNIISNKYKELYLTPKEKLNIQKQLINCYKNAIVRTGKNSKVPILTSIRLLQSGEIDTKEIRVKILDKQNKFSKNDYNISIENVKIALAYCNQVFNLPMSKYNEWQNINFIFEIL